MWYCQVFNSGHLTFNIRTLMQHCYEYMVHIQIPLVVPIIFSLAIFSDPGPCPEFCSLVFGVEFGPAYVPDLGIMSLAWCACPFLPDQMFMTTHYESHQVFLQRPITLLGEGDARQVFSPVPMIKEPMGEILRLSKHLPGTSPPTVF